MDHQFTKQIQAWLNAKHESDADIIKGADMLFRLNRNRFYHTRATRQPQAYRSNIEYELNKFLKIRLDNMTIDEVRQMDAIVIPEAQAIIAEGEPVATTAETNDKTAAKTKENAKNADSTEGDGSTDDAELPSLSSARASAATMSSFLTRWPLSGMPTPSDTKRSNRPSRHSRQWRIRSHATDTSFSRFSQTSTNAIEPICSPTTHIRSPLPTVTVSPRLS